MLVSKKVLTFAAAQHVAQAARAEALKNGWKMVIAVVDDGGHLIYLERMDGAQLGSVRSPRTKLALRCCSSGPARRWKRRLRVAAR